MEACLITGCGKPQSICYLCTEHERAWNVSGESARYTYWFTRPNGGPREAAAANTAFVDFLSRTEAEERNSSPQKESNP